MVYSIFEDTMVEMTWPEIEKAIKQEAVVLFPLGVIEEHGPHLGLAVDTYTAYLIARLVKNELRARSIPALIAPPYYWGFNKLTSGFPGSFTVREETMKAVLSDALISLRNWGVENVFIINWHAEYRHITLILEVIKEVRASKGLKIYSFLTEPEAKGYKLTEKEDYVLVYHGQPVTGIGTEFLDLHAGALETAVMLEYFPEHVRLEIAKSLQPTGFTFQDLRNLRNGGVEARQQISQGYIGAPAAFDLEFARRYIESRVRDHTDLIERTVRRDFKISGETAKNQVK